MSRTAVYSALVLRSRPSGESNSEVFLLTGEEGIIRATVFGGAKSKQRAFASPYNSGQVWVYRDKSKDYAKLSDFDVRSWRPGLREMYDRTMAAAAVAETILSSHGGGGEWARALNLATETLDILESSGEDLCGHLLVHFLWRWAGFLGIQPDVEHCASCGRGEDSLLWFNAHEGTALCATCGTSSVFQSESQASGNYRSANSQRLYLNPGCRRWLLAVGGLSPSYLHRFSMDNKSFHEAKALATAVLAGALGRRLVSWEW